MQMPGARTHPTVKPSVTMNLKNLRQWEIRLGVAHVVSLLGLVTGSMACSFYFGFFTGQDTGFERAYAAGIANAPRLPIALSELPPGGSKEAVSEVYARLHDDHARADSADNTADVRLGDSQELVDIKPLEAVKIADEDMPSEPSERAAAATENAHSRGAASTREVTRVNQDVSRGGATLGGLIEKQAPSTARSDQSLSAPIIQMKKNEIVSNSRSSEPVPAKIVAKSDSKAGKEDAGMVRTVLPKGWFAQIAAPSKRNDAEALAKQLKASGFPVVIENANVRGQEYFRVLVGPEQTRAQGDRLVAQLKRERSVVGDPFLRLVK